MINVKLKLNFGSHTQVNLQIHNLLLHTHNLQIHNLLLHTHNLQIHNLLLLTDHRFTLSPTLHLS